ncbi:MAG TPA: hypothetical protein VFF24_01905 [Acidimicrobiia bacterium]|nr:hypothetical protein [Acidimicrobiia bacterium]
MPVPEPAPRLTPVTPAPEPEGRPGFTYRKSAIADAPQPLPPLPARREAVPALDTPSVESPGWSPVRVALPLFAIAWVCFAALAAAVTASPEADIAGLGHVLATSGAIVLLVLVTLSVAHTQVSGRRPRPAALGVMALGAAQGLGAAAIGSGPSDLWGLGALVFVLIGLTVPLAWVGGQFQSGVRRQRVERHDSLMASWMERARLQAHQTVESVHRHDVRSMLFVIDGAARTLTDPVHELSEEQRATFAGMLNESVQRLSSMMEVRAGEIEPFAVGGIARAVVHAERKAGRTLTAELPVEITALGRSADVAAVLRTVVGLTARQTAAAVTVRSDVQGKTVNILVEAAGAEHLPLLTDSWEDVSPGSFKSASNEDEASIDLYVSARLLTDQGGDLWSTAGRDRFLLRLPAAPDSRPQEEA